MHEKASGKAVIGLGNLVHEEHLCPGIHIKIILVAFGIKILQCSPGFQEIVFDGRCIHALFFCVLADVLYRHPVIVTTVAGDLADFEHSGDWELLFSFFKIVVVFQCVSAVRRIVVILGSDQIVSKILSVHPEIGKSGLHPDSNVFRQIHGDLVAHQRVIQEVCNKRPFLGLDSFYELHFLGILKTGVFINGDVVGFFRKSPGCPGGVAASLDAHVFAYMIEYDGTITAGFVILIGFHGINGSQILIDLQEHRFHTGRTLKGLHRQRGYRSSLLHLIGDAFVLCRDRSTAADVCNTVFFQSYGCIIPRKTQLVRRCLTGKEERSAVTQKVRGYIHPAVQTCPGVGCNIQRCPLYRQCPVRCQLFSFSGRFIHGQRSAGNQRNHHAQSN